MARTAAPGSRERILAAAGRLFYRDGVRAVGMAQVIEAAGCGKNLLYGHFPSKADLVAAYLELTRAERDAAAGRALAAAGDDPGAALVALTTEIADLVRRREFRGCAFRTYLTEFPADDGAPARVARRYLTDTRAQVDDLTARLDRPDAGELADRIWLIIEGLYASACAPAVDRTATVAVRFVEELVAPA
jgi:AcrR family transcriptional regulator